MAENKIITQEPHAVGNLSTNAFVSPSSFVMLTALRFSRISQYTRLTSIVATRTVRGYHAFHEDKANVLPNLVEPQSAAFKVRQI
jgi:hypothetical protein